MWITDKMKVMHRTKGLLLPSMVLRKAGNVSLLGVVTQPGKEKVSRSAKIVRFDSLFCMVCSYYIALVINIDSKLPIVLFVR